MADGKNLLVKKCYACLQNNIDMNACDLLNLESNFYSYLKQYNLLGLCSNCLNESYLLYQNNISDFLDWLDENDNRGSSLEVNIPEMRNSFDLSEEVLTNRPDDYIDNLQKYVIYLENLVEDLRSKISQEN